MYLNLFPGLSDFQYFVVANVLLFGLSTLVSIFIAKEFRPRGYIACGFVAVVFLAERFAPGVMYYLNVAGVIIGGVAIVVGVILILGARMAPPLSNEEITLIEGKLTESPQSWLAIYDQVKHLTYREFVHYSLPRVKRILDHLCTQGRAVDLGNFEYKKPSK